MLLKGCWFYFYFACGVFLSLDFIHLYLNCFFYEFCACLYVCVTVERDEINPLKACECFIVCVCENVSDVISMLDDTHAKETHTGA